VNLVEAYSVTTIFAAGAFVVLVSGGIDVSFTATAAASQYLAAYLIAQVDCPAAPALVLAAILGVVIGLAILISVSLTAYAEHRGRKAFVARPA
jgi:simple sugar transport system permease protein